MQQQPHSHVERTEDSYDALEPAEGMVEHMTVAGFLRQVPNRWHMNDINRYGAAVGKTAEALHLTYMTTNDRALGMVRMFPVPLLKRVYDTQAVQFGWPRIIEALPESAAGVDDVRKVNRETLKAHERVDGHLRLLLNVAANDEVRGSIAVILNVLDDEMRRIRAELGETATATTTPE